MKTERPALLKDQFRVLTGFDPLSWQSRVFEEYFGRGELPAAVDIPTGLGKTAVMALWLIARAQGTPLPRRLVYVVDRRAVVDQATEFAIKLRENLDKPEARTVKTALGLDGRSLPISTLRGQHVDNRGWLVDPSSVAIIVATVDMAGSRLLFEGYGVSRKMRPYHAGLLGADVLVMLDEAHLVPPFESLLDSIENDREQFAQQREAEKRVIPPFKLLSLSATGRDRDGRTFHLEQRDIDGDAIVRDRLKAKKALSVMPASEDELTESLAKHAWELAATGQEPIRCIVFCDKRKVAENVKSAIERKAKDARVQVEEPELLVGARRIHEREQAAIRLKTLGFIAGSDIVRKAPAFLITTSAGEVGVDLDADHMVCDLVTWERMVQRLGRVNRRGNGSAKVVVVAAEPKPSQKLEQVLAKEPADRNEKERKDVEKFEGSLASMRAMRRPLEEGLRCIPGGDVDASPSALRDLKLRAAETSDEGKKLCESLERAARNAPLRPALTRALVDAWSMTALERHTGRPEVGPWLRGWVDDDGPQTTVLWRKRLPARTSGLQATRKEIESFFEAAPPHASELLETETYRVVEWFMKRVEALQDQANRGGADVQGLGDLAAQETVVEPEASASESDEPLAEVFDPEVGIEGSAILGQADVIAFVLSAAGDLRKAFRLGDLAAADTKKMKASLESSLANAMLVVDARVGGLHDGLLNEDSFEIPKTADDGSAWTPALKFRLRIMRAGESFPDDENWRERLRFSQEVSGDGEVVCWLVVDKWHDDSATEDDRAISRPQDLEQHQSWTEERARKLAGRLGLDAEHTKMLALAARLHDEGKRAERWQRAFNASRDGKIYAKTKGPLNAALLDGYRHEFGSLPYACANDEFKRMPADLQELTLHLIAAHHGHARPVISITGCEDAPPSALVERACEVALRFARLQKRWGPWGLAWWEALLRAADQQASRDNDRRQSAQVVEDG
jgi:CRISPR-associated endonuclease/helicase Cas3